MASPAAPLTDAEKAFFLEHGWLKLTNCFTAEQAAEVCDGVWTRLGMSPTDQSTWTRERTNMPHHRTFDAAEFAPKAWAAICELCGGEERLAPSSREWRDSLIVNLGTPEGAGRPAPRRALPGWHVDGDFFVHYLDSPEQALLVTPLFTDVEPDGGGTVICPAGVPRVARWLHAHPAGVDPWMRPRDHPDFKKDDGRRDGAPGPAASWYADLLRDVPDDGFLEVTGKVGDVFLLHPLMTHTASDNALRRLRIITNPPVGLKEPHCFDRADGNYSLVEKKTIISIGEEKLKGWKPTGPREGNVTQRMRGLAAMKEAEAKRLAEQKNHAVAAA